jgi:hypothetical protein
MTPLCADHGAMVDELTRQGGPEDSVVRTARGQYERGDVGRFPRSARPIPEDAEQPAYSAGPIKHPSSNSLGGACEARTTHPMHSACHALY